MPIQLYKPVVKCGDGARKQVQLTFRGKNWLDTKATTDLTDTESIASGMGWVAKFNI